MAKQVNYLVADARSKKARKWALEDRKEEREAVAAADAGEAFTLAGEMEYPLLNIKQAAAALCLISQAKGIEEDVSDALHCVEQIIADNLERVKELSKRVTHLTWAYHRGFIKSVRTEPGQATEAELDEVTLDRLQAIIDERRPRQVEVAEQPAAA